MIRILAADPTCSADDQAALLTALHVAFPDVAIWSGEGAMERPEESSWDEALVVLHTGQPMTKEAQTFLEAYRHRRLGRAADGTTFEASVLLPVALDPTQPMPPPPLAGRKSALRRPGAEPWGAVVQRLQVHFGLALRHLDHRIFVSYRTVDGSAVAKNVRDGLLARGFRPWLDAADENVQPGDDLQALIENTIRGASAIVLVDTPAARGSHWIRFEVDKALGLSIPILPVVFGETPQVSFHGLQYLQRRVELMRRGWQPRSLKAAEVERVVTALEELLGHAYRRTTELAQRARQTYERHGWQWQPLPQPRRSFAAHRAPPGVALQCTLNHCAIENPRHVPTLQALATAPTTAVPYTHRVIVYGDQPLTAVQIDDIHAREPASRTVSLAHIGQLDALVASHFSSLGMA